MAFMHLTAELGVEHGAMSFGMKSCPCFETRSQSGNGQNDTKSTERDRVLLLQLLGQAVAFPLILRLRAYAPPRAAAPDRWGTRLVIGVDRQHDHDSGSLARLR
jgi:hypothetical protein